MKKVLAFFSLVIIVGAWLASSANAGLVKAEQRIEIKESPQEDLYLAGETVDITAEVIGDVVAAGQFVLIGESVSGDAIIAGERVRIEGAIGDDAHAAGQTTEIVGVVEDDAFAAGETIILGGDSRVGGSVYAAGRRVEILGTVSGNVRMAGSELVVGPEAVIEGDLITYGKKPQIEEGAIITGKQEFRQGLENKEARGLGLLGWVRSVVAWFILAWVLLWLMPDFSKKVLVSLQKQSWRSILIGFLWLMLFAPTAVLLMVSGVGAPLGIIILLATAALLILSYGFGVLVVGHWVYAKALKQAGPLTWQHALLGAVVLKGAQLIPGIGWLIAMALVIVMLGVLLNMIWQARRR